MSKKSKRKTDLRSSILILLLIAILLISSTYAWFTANQVVTVSTLEVHVEASSGLQISTDANNWKSIISNEDITTNAYTGHANQVPTNMAPVSTVGEIDASTGYMKMYYGTVAANETSGEYELTATQETTEGTDTANEAGKYIAFDMFLKVDKDTRIQMSTASGVTVPDGGLDRGLKQSSRIAFCIEGNKPIGTAAADIIPLKGATSFGDGGSVYIWEPNSESHTDAAITHAKSSYGLDIADGDYVNYFGVNNAIDTGIELADTMGNDTTNFKAVNPQYKTVETMAATEVFSLTAGITKVRVYMWVEGQDVDCENAASGTDIQFDVQFEIIEDNA